ncbi:MAG: CopG family ribbon-helix-helix protein [Nitrososphaerota archaeon]|nr:CopG family ribbon-helix-helix protein [Nitrososphaerota archaeon]
MAIISLSLPDSMVKSMDEIQDSVGFSGRSELVRAAIRLLLEDTRAKDDLAGNGNAVIVVGHASADEEPVTRLKHKYEDIVRTHVHVKVSHEDCVEVFVLTGEGEEIASMTKELEKERKIRSVKLIQV